MRNRPFFPYFILLCSICLLCYHCVKPYEPPEVITASSLLVVDGMLLAGANATSEIKLSRTRRLNDTATSSPETGATVVIEGENQTRYQLTEGPKGIYRSDNLPLQPSGRYRVTIQTADGTQAASEYVSFKQTPPIDSLNWVEQNGAVTIFVNTRDPRNDTRYYRWEFAETWEYRAVYDAVMAYENGVLFFREPEDQRYKCWKANASTGILLGTSAALAQDVIFRKPLVTMPTQSKQLGVRYSIGVKQYALTKEAFQYWQILQKNSEQRGSLFDSQPAQLVGNIRNLTNPNEPVVGYFSASTFSEERLFIRQEDIIDKYVQEADCPVIIVSRDSANYYMDQTKRKPAYGITGGGFALAFDYCVDCTLQEGTNKKPSFW